MRDRCYVESYSFFYAEPSKCPLGKVSAIVSDDAMRIAISQDNILQEGHSYVAITFFYRLHLYLLGEFVHHYEYVCHLSTSWPKWADHVQAPDSKWPGDGNRLEA